jgi:hypothetical protein
MAQFLESAQSTLVLAGVSRVKEVADLLQQAAEGANSFHRERLCRLAIGFASLGETLERVASKL